jgi:aminoglycoside phosphotransferase (APT) family kinase protein
MSPLPTAYAALAPLLPEAKVGSVSAIQPISMGLSGSGVYAVSSTRGELVLRVQPERLDASMWTQQLEVLRRAAAHRVAPEIIHVDEAAHAIVSRRVAGVPLPAALADPTQRGPAITSIVEQLRTLHGLDGGGLALRDPLPFARDKLASQRVRPGFPAWVLGCEQVLAAAAEVLARDPRRVLSHNDLNPGNVLWDGTRAWLVDWEITGLSHPFYDLAVLAMFLQLDEVTAHGLLAMQEQRPIAEDERATFATLRRLAAILCGLVFLSLLPDLGVLPANAPTLAEFYAALRAGQVDLQLPSGQAAFALALLGVGVG